MRIALIGTRGVPARYGGFETCAEEVGRRLVRRGHEVWVYGRRSYYDRRPAVHEGMRLVWLPALEFKFIETLSHTALSLVHASRLGADVFLVFNSANSPLCALPSLAGRKIVLHTDGLEWMREKWRGPGRLYYRLVERLAARLPLALISDSREIERYYREAYRRKTRYIAYGAAIVESRNPVLLARFGLEPGGYFLQLARFEPENNQLLTVRAFERLATAKKLVLVGGARYPTRYAAEVRATLDPRVVFSGFCYEDDIRRELLANAYAFIHGNEVGGTNPGLLQALGAGCFVIARDVAFNREVCGEAAVYFRKDAADLESRMAWALEHESELGTFKDRGRRTIRERYDWDAVAREYERLLLETVRGRR
jgi:glycosyltransferase involved in cell wall biosynthesis